MSPDELTATDRGAGGFGSTGVAAPLAVSSPDLTLARLGDLVDRCAGSDGAHFDVAKVVHAIFKDQFLFATNDSWYFSNDNMCTWAHDKNGLKLRMAISDKVSTVFIERSFYWINESYARSAKDKREHERACEKARARGAVSPRAPSFPEYLTERSEKLLKISKQLKSSGYKDTIIKECKCMFIDDTFDPASATCAAASS